jgi:hypothetical protein
MWDGKLFSSTRHFGLLCLVLLFACGKQEDAAKEDSWSGVDSTATTQQVPLATDVPVLEPEILPNPNFARQVIKQGFVSTQCLNVRAGASRASEITGHVFKCDRLDIFEIQSGWYRVNDAAGYVDGWVSAAFISDSSVPCDFVIPEDYKAPKTPTVDETVSAKYVGVAACVPCHDKPHAGFAKGPYGVWRDHFHAEALETLGRPYSKAFAKKRGIDDPVNDWRCRKCHVTAYGVSADRLGAKYRDEDGVGCEACHGPGGDYLNKHYGPNVNEQELKAMGFKVYSDLSQRDQLCRACHNELSPTYKPFNVEAFSAAIRHWGSEYTINVREENPTEVVIAEPTPVEKPKVEPVFEKFPDPPPVAERAKAADPPKPAAQPKPEPPQPKPAAKPAASGGGGGRLAGVPDTWMLDLKGEKGKVFFPHVKHQKYISGFKEAEVCLVCHHKSKANERPGNCSDGACHKFEATAVANREAAFHGSCRTCHREEGSGPQKCSECHSQS